MRTSKFPWVALGLLFQAAHIRADVVTFTGTEGKLTGTLQTITKDGIIEWQSPYSNEPLKLLADKLDQVEFPSSPQSEDPSPIQISMRNGDVMPATRISSMDEANMVVETTASGTLTIPRSAVASAQFGIAKQNVIYTGFGDIREWTSGIGEPANWKRNASSLVSSGPSIAARDCKLPENFVLSFTLAWDTRTPSYSIGFADSLVKDPAKQDRYAFNFDGSGIRMMRYSAGKPQPRTLAQWPLRPSQFANNSFKIDLRVDRGKRQMELFIDGQSEGIIIDQPNETAPSGSGIIINCQSHSGNQTISQLTITELNDTRTRHMAEKRGDPSLDCMITTEDDRWSGQLLSMTGTAEQPLMLFKTSFAKESWEIPESEISTIFFANKPLKDGPGGEPVFTIEFHDNGKLTTNNCIISGDEVEVIHPVLGPIQIERNAIKTIRRIH